MLELSHVAVGAALAIRIPNPLISIPLAFLSHFIVDYIPHWNPSLYTETEKSGKPSRKSNIIVLADVVLSLTLGFFIAFRFWPNSQRMASILLACFAAVAPDAVEGFYFYLGMKMPFLKKLAKFQHEHQSTVRPLPGLLTQIATILICFYLIFSI